MAKRPLFVCGIARPPLRDLIDRYIELPPRQFILGPRQFIFGGVLGGGRGRPWVHCVQSQWVCCSAVDRDHSVRGMPRVLRSSEAPSPATSTAVVGVIWTLVEAPARLQEAPVTLEAAGAARRGTGGCSGARPSKTVSSMRSRLPRVLVPQVWALCLPWHAGQGAVEGSCETPAAGRAGATACGMPTGDAMIYQPREPL